MPDVPPTDHRGGETDQEEQLKVQREADALQEHAAEQRRGCVGQPESGHPPPHDLDHAARGDGVRHHREEGDVADGRRDGLQHPDPGRGLGATLQHEERYQGQQQEHQPIEEAGSDHPAHAVALARDQTGRGQLPENAHQRRAVGNGADEQAGSAEAHFIDLEVIDDRAPCHAEPTDLPYQAADVRLGLRGRQRRVGRAADADGSKRVQAT